MRVRLIPALLCTHLAFLMHAPAVAEVTAAPFGRLHLDFMAADDDATELGSGTEFRRARIGLEGSIADDWAYKAEYEFSDGETALKDVYLGYSGWTGGEILMGQFKPGFSLEEMTSANYITFMERALRFRPRRSAAPGHVDGIASSGVAAGRAAEAGPPLPSRPCLDRGGL